MTIVKNRPEDLLLKNGEDKGKDKKKIKKRVFRILLVTLLCLVFIPMLFSASAANNAVNINLNGDNLQTVDIIVMLTMIALVPSLLILTTCFTRIIIVLSFLRNALGLQSTPPNQVLIGIALFLTLFVMTPVINEVNNDAYTPYKNHEITQEQFITKASVPLKKFMLKQTKTKDLNLFIDMSKTKKVDDPVNLPITVIIPSFITSELKRAFLIGFLIYIPFLIIDMIVSSTLMSMGMIMLAPATISLPFKLLLFVLVDGWELLFKALVASFN